jgi:hypothetical protein
MTTRLGIGAAVGALLAAALTTLAPSSASAQDPLLGAPVVGQCFDLSTDELASPEYPEAPIDCATDHTAQVVAVATLPDGMVWSGEDYEQFALETCYPAIREAIGAKNMLAVNLSAYTLGYFGPTADQQAAGARWMRCDLALGSLAGLHPLPTKLKVGKFPYKKTVSRCLAGRDFHVTTCAEKHTYRATAAIKIKGKKFPSARAWQRLGDNKCLRGVTSRQFRFGWPSKVGWKAGDRTLTCYSKTRR